MLVVSFLWTEWVQRLGGNASTRTAPMAEYLASGHHLNKRKDASLHDDLMEPSNRGPRHSPRASTIPMKPTRTPDNRQSKQAPGNMQRPEIRDNLDSRGRIEGRFTGDKSKKGDRKPQK
jgi:hypothetical protein